MALHIAVEDVQQWLEPTKLTISAVDTVLEATAFQYVASRLAGRYDPTPWTSTSTTPPLVKSVESMWYAGMYYKRQYSENTDDSGYGNWIVTYATNLMDGLATGKQDILGSAGTVDPWALPQLWPTDASTDLADPSLGGDPTDPNASPRAFRMGQVF